MKNIINTKKGTLCICIDSGNSINLLPGKNLIEERLYNELLKHPSFLEYSNCGILIVRDFDEIEIEEKLLPLHTPNKQVIKKLFIVSAFYEFERACYMAGWLELRKDANAPIIVVIQHVSYRNISLSEFINNMITDDLLHKKINKIAIQKHSQLEMDLKNKFTDKNIFTYDFDNDSLNSKANINDYLKSMVKEKRLEISDDVLQMMSLKHNKYCYLNFLQLCSEQESTLKKIWGVGEFEAYTNAMSEVMSIFK